MGELAVDCVDNAENPGPQVDERFGCGLDKPTGQTDDSFGQGTKEDTAVPTVVNGSIPNNKSDLTRLYVDNERVRRPGVPLPGVGARPGAERHDEHGLRVQPVDRDVEQHGITPVRTAGDVLIKYDLSQGGVNPVLGFHRWVTTGNPATVCEASNTRPLLGQGAADLRRELRGSRSTRSS